MKLDHSKNRVVITEFETNEDGVVANLTTKNLDLIQIDAEEAYFDILDQSDWFAHAVDGIGNIYAGCGSENGKFYWVGNDDAEEETAIEWFEYDENENQLMFHDNEAINGDIVIHDTRNFYLLKREIVERDAALPRHPQVTETKINEAIDVFVRSYFNEHADELTLVG